jgi:hypothetical protein
MERDFVEISIKSFQKRRDDAKERAIAAINDGSYTVALIATTDAMQYTACIEELEFQLECMEAYDD